MHTPQPLTCQQPEIDVLQHDPAPHTTSSTHVHNTDAPNLCLVTLCTCRTPHSCDHIHTNKCKPGAEGLLKDSEFKAVRPGGIITITAHQHSGKQAASDLCQGIKGTCGRQQDRFYSRVRQLQASVPHRCWACLLQVDTSQTTGTNTSNSLQLLLKS